MSICGVFTCGCTPRKPTLSFKSSMAMKRTLGFSAATASEGTIAVMSMTTIRMRRLDSRNEAYNNAVLSLIIKDGRVMRQARILMCPPDYYGIEYEINPWMSRSRTSTPQGAHQQWRKLYETLVGLRVTVELMTPQRGLPDLVFTANAGLIFAKRFFSSSFRYEVRARETPYFDAWFADH